ncbi:hypothetical protein ABL78_3252 [Leptomonas seymouri]|uniref:Uncharacterized protein n=1 Tax=Leptomonas seymouri TaxID=5684 RepID=A0A0N1PCQ5_LEPSE|nr:hypothetical protein ABL78_3252 [Leptomonas seymouri]|eukprot:KPI87654.1 hypothetical protein ABL78_3252 [Leptomonas seymouri]
MVKYVDAGTDTGDASKKKKSRKGFKADRLENYKRMIAKKSGKKVRETPTPAARPKALTFDDAARRSYLLTLHKKKNERRVQAFVDMKRKLRKDSAKTRREQREEARRAYNNYARVPILPDYTYRLPDRHDEGFGEDEEGDADYTDDDAGDHTSQEGEERVDDDEMPWMGLDAPEAAAHDARENFEAHAEASRKRKKAKRLATIAHSSHAMPGVMLGQENGEGDGAAPSPSSAVEDEFVTVEVKPLFARPGASSASSSAGDNNAASAAKPLPSNNFDDLPAVVQQELRRLRQETKGPAKTKPRLRMMKELEKIRKIRKHSRKGHGKRKASGKRKNRKK